MMEITKTRQVFANANKLWEVVSDLDNERKYWTGLKEINVLRRNGNTIERETTVGLRNLKSRQTLVRHPKESHHCEDDKGSDDW